LSQNLKSINNPNQQPPNHTHTTHTITTTSPHKKPPNINNKIDKTFSKCHQNIPFFKQTNNNKIALFHHKQTSHQIVSITQKGSETNKLAFFFVTSNYNFSPFLLGGIVVFILFSLGFVLFRFCYCVCDFSICCLYCLLFWCLFYQVCFLSKDATTTTTTHNKNNTHNLTKQKTTTIP